VGQERKVEVIVGPITLDGDVNSSDSRRLIRLVEGIEAQGGVTNTPIARSIQDVLDPVVGKDFWPANSTGARTLIVLTDGTDNRDEQPADLVRTVLRRHEDVSMHLVLFSMADGERRQAIEQFEALEKADSDQDVSTSFTLWRNVKDGTEFAADLQAAVLPRLRYADGKTRGMLIAAAPSARIYNVSPALPPGSYTLTGGAKLPKLQLEPGDRVLLRAERHDGHTVLSTPPLAYEFSKSLGDIPVSVSDDPQGNRLHMAVPERTLRAQTPFVHLQYTATLESTTPTRDDALLVAPRPILAWFDIKNADGTALDLGNLHARIENRPGLIAPAWQIHLNEWDNENPNGTIRKPLLEAHWIDSLPPAIGSLDLKLNRTEQALADANGQKVFASGGADVEWLDAQLVTRNQQKYLVLWWKLSAKQELVMARLTGLKGVTERHSYYVPQRRYTVQYGPLSPGDDAAQVKLSLYQINLMRERARSASISFANRTMESKPLNNALTLTPQPAPR
jgi:hypothetical protein